MTVSLQKGQRIDLTKGNAQLDRIQVGLGWDSASASSTKKKGFLAALTPQIDCDASVIMLQDGKFQSKKDLIYFMNKKSNCKSVIHSGDNLTGKGSGDDEVITVDLKSVPASYDKIVFVVNIYSCVSRKQDFGMISNAFIRIVDPTTGNELVKYNLSDDYQGLTSLIVGEIYRHGQEWKFSATGDGTTDKTVNEICQRFA
ncbi:MULTISPECIES: TerD family protein [unclassified Psychrobacillus]|uniref:TerD family protein n=1 Tax=unclassified Psychrobacillus TaxID=2636677 RepID=UPI0030F557D4